MNIKEFLESLNRRIKGHFPKLPKKPSITASQKNRRAIIDDIQQKLAEMYALIDLAIKDPRFNTTYQEAIKKNPNDLKATMNSFSVLALAVKTKLNINKTDHLFLTEELEPLDLICFDCYRVEFLLSGSNTPNKKDEENYSKGIDKEYSFENPHAKFGKILKPCHNPGQLFITPHPKYTLGNNQNHPLYINMVLETRQKLDPSYKPTRDQIITIYSSGPNYQEQEYFKTAMSTMFPSTKKKNKQTKNQNEKEEGAPFCGFKKGFLN